MSMQEQTSVGNREIEEAASAWLVRRQFSARSADDPAFQAWLSADPRHVNVFNDVERAWQVLNRPRTEGMGRRLRQEMQARRRRRNRRRGFAAITVALLLLAFWISPSRLPSSGTVEIRPDRQTLADGSVIELNAGGRVDFAYTAEKRSIRLVAGTAHFDVARDPLRPFVVTAGNLEIRALGTAFLVRLDEGRVDVVVSEGAVRVDRAPENPAGRHEPEALSSAPIASLKASHRVIVDAFPDPRGKTEVQTLSGSELAAAMAWRGKRIEFSGTPLSEAVSLFNGQNKIQLQVDDPALNQHEISGIFWSDDPEGFVRLLESGMNVRSVRQDGSIVLTRR